MNSPVVIEYPFHGGLTIQCVQKRPAHWIIRLVNRQKETLCQKIVSLTMGNAFPKRIMATASSMEQELIFSRLSKIRNYRKRRNLNRKK